MGLDVYMRWGKYNDDEAPYWPDMPEDVYEAQHTGYVPAPESGYLRLNWAGVSFCETFPTEVNAPKPLDLYPEWNGENGDSLPVTAETWPKIAAHRDALRKWLVSGRKTVRDEKKQRSENWWSDFRFFETVCREVIGFINFTELHKDEPDAVILFW